MIPPDPETFLGQVVIEVSYKRLVVRLVVRPSIGKECIIPFCHNQIPFRTRLSQSWVNYTHVKPSKAQRQGSVRFQRAQRVENPLESFAGRYSLQ